MVLIHLQKTNCFRSCFFIGFTTIVLRFTISIRSLKENLIQAIRPTQIQAIRVRTNTMMYLYSLLLLTSIPTTLASVMVLDSRGNVEMVDQEYDARYNSLRVNAMTYRGVWGVVTEDAKINYDLVLKGKNIYSFFLVNVNLTFFSSFLFSVFS